MMEKLYFLFPLFFSLYTSHFYYLNYILALAKFITSTFFNSWLCLVCWRRKWQPTPVFLPGESQGRGSLVGCRLWGRTESDTTEVT